MHAYEAQCSQIVPHDRSASAWEDDEAEDTNFPNTQEFQAMLESAMMPPPAPPRKQDKMRDSFLSRMPDDHEVRFGGELVPEDIQHALLVYDVHELAKLLRPRIGKELMDKCIAAMDADTFWAILQAVIYIPALWQRTSEHVEQFLQVYQFQALLDTPRAIQKPRNVFVDHQWLHWIWHPLSGREKGSADHSTEVPLGRGGGGQHLVF